MQCLPALRSRCLTAATRLRRQRRRSHRGLPAPVRLLHPTLALARHAVMIPVRTSCNFWLQQREYQGKTGRQPHARLQSRTGKNTGFVEKVCVRAELVVVPDDSAGPRLATLPAPALPSADAGLPAAAGSGTPPHRHSAPVQQSAVSREMTAALLPASAGVRRGPASAPDAASALPASTEVQLPSAQPPTDRPSSAGTLLPRRPNSSHAPLVNSAPGQDVASKQPPNSDRTAAGASQPAMQQADGEGRASQASPRTPLQRVQSSPMASPAASQAEAACCPQSPCRSDTNGAQQAGIRASPAGKENRDDSQTPPPSSQPQAQASQSQRGAAAAELRLHQDAVDAALPQAHAEPGVTEAAEAAMPQRSPAEGSRQPGKPASDSQATQPLEALPPRPSPVTPDAPISSGDGALRGGARAERISAGVADPLQLSATAPTLPKGLAGPPPDAAGAAGPPQGGLPLPSADDGSGPQAAPIAPPKEHSPVKTAAGQQHLPPQVNRFFAASAQLPAPGRTPAGGITVEAFNAIVPFPWRPSGQFAARAGAVLGGVPTAAPAVTVAAPVPHSGDSQSRPPTAARPAEAATGSAEQVDPDPAAAAVILVSDTTHSGTASKTPSRPQSTGSASGGNDGVSVAEGAEPAAREPTGDTQTQDEELPLAALGDGAPPAEPHAAGPSGAADAAPAEGDDGGGVAPAAWPTDEEVQVHALQNDICRCSPSKHRLRTPTCPISSCSRATCAVT